MFLLPGIKAGLASKHRIMPEYLRELGYETHLVGKWHLGYHSPQMIPTARGFDTFYGSYLNRLHYYNLSYQEVIFHNHVHPLCSQRCAPEIDRGPDVAFVV